MNWKRLLAAIKAAGYTGDGDLDSVKAFVSDNEVIDGGSGMRVTGETVAKMAGPRGKAIVIAFADSAIEGVERSGGEPSAEADEPEDEKMADGEEEDEKSAPAPKGKRPTPNEKGVATERKIAAAHASIAPGVGNAEERAYTNRIKRFGVGGGRGQAAFSDASSATAFGAWSRLALMGEKSYPQRAKDLDILRKTGLTTAFTSGGSYVPDEFRPDLIEIFLEHGVARQVAGVTPMSRDVLELPKLTDDVTTSWTGEGSSNTATDIGTGLVQLTARKLMSVTNISSELLNDSAISIADTVARSIARSQAAKEDNAYFVGDGTSTYGQVEGVVTALGSAGTATSAAAETWAKLALSDVIACFAKLPNYPGMNPVIVCSREFYYQTLVRLMHESNTTDSTTVTGRSSADASAAPRAQFFGAPVYFSNAMPRTTAVSTVSMLYGDFSMGTKFGEVSGGLSIATSEHANFNSDLIAIRGRNRVAINVHDAGDSSNAGPIVGLKTASS